MATITSTSELHWRDVGNGYQRAEVELAKGETCFNPASTKRLIYGPCKVEFMRCPSGSLNAYVS